MLSSRKKSCYFKRNKIHEIDYKDTRLLNKFINDQGKIVPRRVTGTSAKMHRKLAQTLLGNSEGSSAFTIDVNLRPNPQMLEIF